MKRKFLFAIRDTKNNKLVNAKCGKSGKYYEMVAYANNRVKQLNDKVGHDRYKVVTFELKEIE